MITAVQQKMSQIFGYILRSSPFFQKGVTDSISDLKEFRKAFDPLFTADIRKKVSTYAALAGDSESVAVAEHAAALMLGPGKRVRPYLCYLAYRAEGGRTFAEAVQLGIALEIFHAFALIHDDIIDAGSERHGLPTVHVWAEKRIPKDARVEHRRVSEGVAILAGDLAFAWSTEEVARMQRQRVRDLYFNMVQQTVSGQLIDVNLVTKKRAKSSELARKNELKTSRYSFVSPMQMGAALAGSATAESHAAFYEKLGLLLGEAFQIQDDLLDAAGDSAKTGKNTMLDIQAGQHTLITQHVFEHGSQRDRDILDSLFGKPVDESSRKVLARLFDSSGALRHARAEAERKLSEARSLIRSSHLKHRDAEAFLGLVSLLDHRIS